MLHMTVNKVILNTLTELAIPLRDRFLEGQQFNQQVGYTPAVHDAVQWRLVHVSWGSTALLLVTDLIFFFLHCYYQFL